MLRGGGLRAYALASVLRVSSFQLTQMDAIARRRDGAARNELVATNPGRKRHRLTHNSKNTQVWRQRS